VTAPNVALLHDGKSWNFTKPPICHTSDRICHCLRPLGADLVVLPRWAAQPLGRAEGLTSHIADLSDDVLRAEGEGSLTELSQ
jgi:hypothetical protein